MGWKFGGQVMLHEICSAFRTHPRPLGWQRISAQCVKTWGRPIPKPLGETYSTKIETNRYVFWLRDVICEPGWEWKAFRLIGNNVSRGDVVWMANGWGQGRRRCWGGLGWGLQSGVECGINHTLGSSQMGSCTFFKDHSQYHDLHICYQHHAGVEGPPLSVHTVIIEDDAHLLCCGRARQRRP